MRFVPGPMASPQADVESLIASMNEGGVNMACVIPEGMGDLSYGHRVRFNPTGTVPKRWLNIPDRLIGAAKCRPIVARGVDKANWELEYLVKERGFKACKFFLRTIVPINGQRLMAFL